MAINGRKWPFALKSTPAYETVLYHWELDVEGGLSSSAAGGPGEGVGQGWPASLSLALQGLSSAS